MNILLPEDKHRLLAVVEEMALLTFLVLCIIVKAEQVPRHASHRPQPSQPTRRPPVLTARVSRAFGHRGSSRCRCPST